MALPPCPLCACPIRTGETGWQCEGPACTFGVPRMIRQKVLLEEDVAALIADKKTRLIPGFQRKGNSATFSGCLVLEENGAVRLLPGLPTMRRCPLCLKMLLQNERGLLCSDVLKCGLVVPRQFYGKELSAMHIDALVEHGETSLIAGFVSKKNGSVFSAQIAIDRSISGHRLHFVFPDAEKPPAPCKAAGT